MRLHRPATEDEMVALFLSEVNSPRFRAELLGYLSEVGLPERILTQPDLSSPEENRARKEILARHRGYGRHEGLFEDFPEKVRWEWVWLTPEEVARVRYLDYDYWVELSGGSGLPADAALRIRAGVSVFGRMSTEWALHLADTVAGNPSIPPMILLAEDHGLVCYEGNARLTAYMLRPEDLPGELLVMVGTATASGQDRPDR